MFVIFSFVYVTGFPCSIDFLNLFKFSNVLKKLYILMGLGEIVLFASVDMCEKDGVDLKTVAVCHWSMWMVVGWTQLVAFLIHCCLVLE